eukprot:CAMPEP_0197177454 /NCGR_PEP_ID=MMETSP1423-20130617/3045_1 /TAXON_ID=476441 /ORGANISM="Pseudo-nitzschia heimii, Strain UNC1101" /LENGTH=422 /DNA_ID=CAMNT_0042626997 /DNA_START=299 /DNA_END=1567 /DNA_ORIENTATION=-
MQLFCAITVKNGQRVPLLLEDSDLTPTQLRLKVSEVTKIPLTDLRLIFRGRMIKDDDSLPSVAAEYKLEDESVLHCMGKPVPETVGRTTAKTKTAATAPTASAPATAGVPNRTAVLYPSMPTATNPAVAAASARASSSPAPSGGGDALSKALARLKQHNPPSQYATAVGTLEKVLGNIAGNPMEEKYRRVKRGNAAFGKRLGKLTGGHDCMLACGFAVEFQAGEEVYQLHASPEKWTALMAFQERVKAASAAAKEDQSRSRQPPTAGGIGGTAAAAAAAAGAAAAPLGGMPMPNANHPDLQNMMSQFMSNPEALGQALQNPMLQEMIRNDPNVPPETRRQMETMASNPAMLQQLARQMQNPAVQSRLQRAMQSGGLPGMGGGGTAPPRGAAAPPPPPPQQNDPGQTEEEMIAEAIRRSLEDN